MHMGDALISPVVGGTMLAAAVAVSAVSIKKVKEMDEKKLPLMGVMAAFVFAAQMINFTIPGTGSSGHLGGGMLLAVILGPYAGFLSLAAILLIQALFFADGGYLAYGCNLINMGFYACFIAYPFIYKFFTKRKMTRTRIALGSIIASIIGLQLGAFSVVLQTVLSGKTAVLPFNQFVWTMQGIHLAIGLVEGIVTAAVVSFVWKVRPDIINEEAAESKKSNKALVTGFLIAALALGGIVSLFASANPDGLEWSIGKVTGKELKGDTEIHDVLEKAQEKTAVLPDYGFKSDRNSETAGTAVSGIAGSGITLGTIVLIGFVINYFKKRRIRQSDN